MQNHISYALTILGYPFEEQQSLNGKPDFILPNKKLYQKNPAERVLITAKRTLRERWRQIITEGFKSPQYFLITIDEKQSPNLQSCRERNQHKSVPEWIPRPSNVTLAQSKNHPLNFGCAMEVRITTLSENAANLGFIAEWGLSVLVEMDEATVLLDARKGFSTAHNADSPGINLSKIDKIILSHGHYDHTGGLREVLRRMKKQVEIIAHPDIWQAKYARRKDEPDRYIGIPFQRDGLENLGASFHLTTQPINITSTAMTTGEIPMVTAFEEVDAALFVKEGIAWWPDKVG